MTPVNMKPHYTHLCWALFVRVLLCVQEPAKKECREQSLPVVRWTELEYQQELREEGEGDVYSSSQPCKGAPGFPCPWTEGPRSL